MARSLTAAALAETQAAQLSPILLFKAQFTSGYVYLWSGMGDLTWDGQTWQGIGVLGGVSEIEETTDIKANGIRVSLSGVPSNMISIALAEVRQNKPCFVYIGFLSASGTIIIDPYQLFAGRLDVPEINDSADTAVLTITAENRLIDLDKARMRYYTDADLKIDYPTDKGFEYVSAIQDIEIEWGK